MRLSARDVTRKNSKNIAEQIVCKAVEAAEGRSVRAVDVGFSENSSKETRSIFSEEFIRASENTSIEGASLNVSVEGGGMPGDEDIYFEGVQVSELEEENSVYKFFRNLMS